MGWRTQGFPGSDDQQPWGDDALDAASGQFAPDDLDGFDGFDGFDGAAEPAPDAPIQSVVAQDFSTRRLPAISDTREAPVIVRGSGVVMGNPIIKRRERPLTLRIAVLTLMVCILVTGIFTISPLGGGEASAGSTFQALASSMVVSRQPRYFLYTAVTNDTPELIAKKFKVQVGGIYELNNLYAGEEISIGVAYKIPEDPSYGKGYMPATIPSLAPAHFGSSRFGPNWWDSNAGVDIPGESPCAPDGGQNPLGFKLTSPNWNSYWVRGYIVYGTWVYHTGVDLAAPRGNPIRAAQQGQVIWAGYDSTNGLGWSVKIDHCHHLSTVYGHMDKLLVSVGEYVQQGQEVGLEGSTGNSTGPHLHYMVEWNNMWLDPMLYYTSKYTISHYVSP
jgi:murein DD-endopeptidase MepM/ murein hydrolase activator NlpD